MSSVRNMDGSSGVGSQERWHPPPSLPVRQPAQVQHGGKNCWPFLYSYKEGGCVVNTAPRRSAYASAQDVGDALI
jgi:hypothetical protein